MYEDVFEKKFLVATENLYAAEGQKYMQDNDVSSCILILQLIPLDEKSVQRENFMEKCMEKFLTKVSYMKKWTFEKHIVHEKVDKNEFINTLILK